MTSHAQRNDPVVAQVEPDPSRPYAAYVAALITVLSFVLTGWVFDDTPKKESHYTMSEFKGDIGQGLIASGLVGVGTFASKKPLRKKA